MSTDKPDITPETQPPKGVRFITPNALMLMPTGSLQRLDVLEQEGNVPVALLTYDDATPQRLHALLHDPFSRHLCEMSLKASYMGDDINLARDMPEFQLSVAALSESFGRAAQPLYDYLHTHPDAPRQDWIPKLYDAIAEHLESDAPDICRRAKQILSVDYKHHDAEMRKGARADYWHRAMVHAPTPGFQSLYFVMSHILHNEAEIAQDQRRDTQQDWHTMREATMEAFGALPPYMQQLLAHRGVAVVAINNVHTDLGGYATIGYDMLCINHAGADEGPHKLQMVLNEEAIHKMDEWFGFTSRPEWVAAAKADMARPEAREMLGLLRTHLGSKDPIDGTDTRPDTVYSRDDMAYELLPELFNLKYFDLHRDGKPLDVCFPACSKLLAQFEQEMQTKAQTLGHTTDSPTYRVEATGLNRHLYPVAPAPDAADRPLGS